LVLEPWQLLEVKAFQVIGPGSHGVVAASAAKIKIDSCMHPVLIRYKLTKGKK